MLGRGHGRRVTATRASLEQQIDHRRLPVLPGDIRTVGPFPRVAFTSAPPAIRAWIAPVTAWRSTA